MERDFRIFEALHRHGPLPTHYLHEFARGLGGNYAAHQQRLTKLYNGTKQGVAYLTRPAQQFASYEARYQPLIYDLAPKAKRALAEHGRLSPFIPDRTDPFVHRFMSACVSASIELGATKQGLRYIAKGEIFERAGLSSDGLAIPVRSRALVPDDLFGLEYPGRGYRFFAVEIDRHTESIDRSQINQTAFGAKLHSYLEIAKNKTYHSHWRVPNLMILTVTTNMAHLHKVLIYLDNITAANPQAADRFLYKGKPNFGSNFSVPTIMYDLLSEPWIQSSNKRLAIDRA